MTIYQRYDPLLQTYVEVETQLSDLTHWISKNRYLEIGDDPHVVQSIENALLRIQLKINSLGPYFDLDKTPLRKANIYFTLVKHVNDTLQYLREVRKRDFGSKQQTLELLEKLSACINSLGEIGGLTVSRSDIIH
jgi:hypothetical protein